MTEDAPALPAPAVTEPPVVLSAPSVEPSTLEVSPEYFDVLRAARWYVSQSNGSSKELLLERIDRILNTQ